MKLVVSLITDIVSIIVSAFCGVIIWNWFMPPISSAIPVLTFSSAVGLSFVLTVFNPSSSSNKFEQAVENPDLFFFNAVFNQIMNGITKPIFVLFYAWVAKEFIF